MMRVSSSKILGGSLLMAVLVMESYPGAFPIFKEVMTELSSAADVGASSSPSSSGRERRHSSIVTSSSSSESEPSAVSRTDCRWSA